MPYGEKARRHNREWWGKRPLAGYSISFKGGTNKFWKRRLHKIERQQGKSQCEDID